ncbi:hypothetical protein BC831DRAFT_440033 [Entophlyctis helioformis]|nr:hypothetical protein BC831DRAFT_440033 [Entophlyctis helioformis]
MSLLSLKIYLADTDTTKTCQYMSDMYVQDVTNDVREKFCQGESGLDHGLLLREQSLWLAPNKLLDHYDLKYGDTLEFRKRHRVLKVKTLDNSIKAVLIDESLPVRLVVAAVCERIGILNNDEYSFTLDTVEGPSSKKNAKKSKAAENLYTEGRSWLNPEKTLREQGISEGDIIILKKKFFYTDQNVDRNDPVQLMLMYNQSREMIVTGKHPCTASEAAQLAGIQMQIQYGNHEADRHKPGFVKLKDFVPPEYHKSKDVEKRLYAEHAKLQNLGELNAKFRYVQMCRSLKTYGVSFFLVKEPATKKKKAASVLLGITKESIIRMDIESKEELSKWYLKQLRRWAATPKGFTLDFGEYSDSYYSVETPEGEQISRLISGYIDIIVKRRNQASRNVEEQRVEEQAVMEDYVQPGRANAVNVVSSGSTARQAKESHSSGGGVVFYDDGQQPDRLKINRYAASPVPQGEIAQNLDVLEFQQAIIQTISNGLAVNAAAHSDLSSPTHLAPLSEDPATLRWRQETCDMTGEAVASHIASGLAAVGALIIHATGNTEDMDYDTIGAKLFTVISSVGQITQGIKMLSGLQSSEADQESLLDSAKRVNVAMAQILRHLQPIITGNLIMDDFYSATREMASASAHVLRAIDHLEMSDRLQQELLDAAAHVGDCVSLAVQCAQNMASTIRDPEVQQMTVADSALAAEIAAMLAAVAGALSPTVHVSVCREQLMEGSVLMRDGAVALLSYADRSTHPDFVALLQDAVAEVEQAIARLIDRARHGEASKDDEIDAFYDQILVALDNLVQQLGDPEQLIANAKQLTVSATRLAEVLKSKAAETQDPDERDRLLMDAREISELMSKMVMAAKEAVKNPDANDDLVQVLAALKDTVDAICAPYVKASTTQRLVQALKSSAASANQLVAASRNCAPSNRDQSTQMTLNRAAKKTVETIPKVVQAIKETLSKPDDFVVRLRLIQSAKAFLEPSLMTVEAARNAAPTTVDSAPQRQLLAAAQQLGDELDQLREILEIVQQITAAERISGAEESLKATQIEIRRAYADPKTIVLAPEFEASRAEVQVTMQGKSLQHILGKMAHAVNTRDERAAGSAISETIECLQALAQACIGISASTEAPELRQDLLDATSHIGDCIGSLIHAARDALADPTKQPAFDEMAVDTDIAVVKTVQCLPGQRALTRAVRKIRTATVTVGGVMNTPSLHGSTTGVAGNRWESQDGRDRKLGASVAGGLSKMAHGSGTNKDAPPGTNEVAGRALTTEEIHASMAAAVAASSMRSAPTEDVQARLIDAAMELTAATNSLVIASNSNPAGLLAGASKIETAFESLVEASVVLASLSAASQADATSEPGEQVDAVHGEDVAAVVRTVGAECDQFLASLKGSALDPENAGLKGMLLNAAKSVGDTVDQLLHQLSVAAPGYDQCNQALQVISTAASLVDDVNAVPATVQATYSETVAKIGTAEQSIADILVVIASHSASHNGPKLADAVVKLADTVKQLTEQSVLAAQMVGANDPSSQPAVPPIIDQKALIMAAHSLKDVCRKLVDKNNTQREILEGASALAQQTTAICNWCKAASLEPKLDAPSKKEFMRFAKDTATKTSQLVGSIKQLALKRNDEARSQCQDAAKLLTATMDELVDVACAPQYAGSPAKVSSHAASMQKPVLESTMAMLEQLREITVVSQGLCGSPSSDDLKARLMAETQELSKIVAAVVANVKDAGPAQKECQAATESLNETAAAIDAAMAQAMAAAVSNTGSLGSGVARTVAAAKQRGPASARASVNARKSVNASSRPSVAAGGAPGARIMPMPMPVPVQPTAMEKAALQENLQILSNLVEVVARSSRGDLIQLSNAIEELPISFGKAANVAIGMAAASSSDVNLQAQLFESTRALADALSSYVTVIKEDSADPNDFGQIQVESEKASLKAAITDLMGIIEGPTDAKTAEFIQANDKVEKVLLSLDKTPSLARQSMQPSAVVYDSPEKASQAAALAKKPFQFITTDIEQTAKRIIESLAPALSKDVKSDEFAAAVVKVSDLYENLTMCTSAAMNATEDDDLRKHLMDLAREVGGTTLRVVEAMRNAAAQPTPDATARLKVSQAVREISTKLVDLNKTAQQGSKGIMACQSVLNQIDDMIAEFETSSIFAQAKQLDPIDGSKGRFNSHKDDLLKATKSLNDTVKLFAHAHSSTQDELAFMANEAVGAVRSIKEHVIKAATALTSSDSDHQLQLLMLAKVVASSLQMLVKAAGNASGMPSSSRLVVDVQEAVRQQQDTIRDLAELVSDLCNESQRVNNALESVTDDIDAAVKTLNNKNLPALGTALPEEVVSMARLVAGTAAAVVAKATSQTQEATIQVVGEFNKVVQDLLRASKAATANAPDDFRLEMVNAVTGLAIACKGLVLSVRAIQEDNNVASKQQMQASAKEVSLGVTEVVKAAGKLVPQGYLLTAASAIEAAAKRLAALRPVERPREANEDLNFEEQILEATKAIAAATSALVRSATGAQRELVARGRTGPKEEAMYYSDGTWSDGLVSSAKQVAAATADLCEAANEAVKGNVQRERVIVCAKGVSTSTVQLLTAAAVRSDPSLQSQIRLRAAGKAVTDATELLVEAAKANAATEDEAMSTMTETPTSATRNKVIEMEAQMNILRMEKELERARSSLAAVRKGRYTSGANVAMVSPSRSDAAYSSTTSRPQLASARSVSGSGPGYGRSGESPTSSTWRQTIVQSQPRGRQTARSGAAIPSVVTGANAPETAPTVDHKADEASSVQTVTAGSATQ